MSAGNIVVIDHGNGEYSVTAHLKQNSIRVKPGDRVKRGQVIAKCGNSGSSPGAFPHIHVQLQNSGTLCAADSLPFGFSDTEVDGQRKELASPTVGDSIEGSN